MKRILNDGDLLNKIKNLSLQELDDFTYELRDFILKSVSNTGGHLASNLGVVELTLALHYSFDSPTDKLIWDVGHQAYVHKILTGRMNQFDTLRQYNGLSGFLKKSESDHDIFEAGHSSTSISAAMGIAKARDLKNESYEVVPIIGDGALTGGMALEALNNICHLDTNINIILNDNEMSIDQNIGGISKYLSKIRTTEKYKELKFTTHKLISKIPCINEKVDNFVHKFKQSVKYFFIPGVFFEEMGLTYIGPINGHDLESLLLAFEQAKQLNHATIVHVVTKKGKGYKPAEQQPDKYHGVGSFNLSEGLSSIKKNKTYSEYFSDTFVKMAQEDEALLGITAAMPSGTKLNAFQKMYPDRYYDIGIAEQHAVTFAAGLATNGMIPYFAVYSTFLQRAYDQVLHDVCLQNLKVRLCIDRAGLVGNDGETHHGVFDLSYLLPMPNLRVYAPKDGHELEVIMRQTKTVNAPVAIRYPRGEAENFGLEIGDINQPEIVIDGTDICVIAVGKMVLNAYKAALLLAAEDISVRVINPRILKPINCEEYQELIRPFKHVITIEDNMIIGGFGQYLTSLLKNKKFYSFGISDEFVPHGNIDKLYDIQGLSVDKIASKIKKIYIERG